MPGRACPGDRQRLETPDRGGVSVRFKILRTGTTTVTPASRDARADGCTCPVRENRAGGGWDVSDDETLRGFWINEQCAVHATALSNS
jgi:hypothetical protein